jgi:hypothetical protein
MRKKKIEHEFKFGKAMAKQLSMLKVDKCMEILKNKKIRA